MSARALADLDRWIADHLRVAARGVTRSSRRTIAPLNSGERDARHSVHSSRTRGTRRSTKGSLSARDIRLRSRRTSASGRKAGRTSAGTSASSVSAVSRWFLRLADQLIDRRARSRRLLAGKDLFEAAAVLSQKLQRHEQLPPRGVERQRRNRLHHAVGKAGMAREVIDRLRRPHQETGAAGKQRRGGVVGITFQRRQRRHRVVVEIELVLLDQPHQPFDRQPPGPDRPQQFGGDRIALDAAVVFARAACRSTIAGASRPAAAG